MERPLDTKAALLEAAGELFAELGFEGASVRAIAERAGTNVASVNYHFGSKERLYAELLQRVLLTIRGADIEEFLRPPERIATPDGAASVVREVVRARFASYFSDTHPSWYRRLVMRSLIEPSAVLQRLMRDVFVPEHAALSRVFRGVNPSLTEEEISLFSFTLTGQIAFFGFAEIPILAILGRDRYDGAFLEAAADHVATSVIAALGLK
ncbi:MAG: CerR family C-terminal domain-containing protein [Candidatus Hydrogenedentes bacterium]|nr:CerR family C-terminal domain-containing protein [Candidatus Hydrogenedentota bacterium]